MLGKMAVNWGTEEYNFLKMCRVRKIAVFLAVFIGVLGFSFGDAPPKTCDLVYKDFERILKTSNLRFTEKPETGKKRLYTNFCFVETIICYLCLRECFQCRQR